MTMERSVSLWTFVQWATMDVSMSVSTLLSLMSANVVKDFSSIKTRKLVEGQTIVLYISMDASMNV